MDKSINREMKDYLVELVKEVSGTTEIEFDALYGNILYLGCTVIHTPIKCSKSTGSARSNVEFLICNGLGESTSIDFSDEDSIKQSIKARLAKIDVMALDKRFSAFRPTRGSDLRKASQAKIVS